MSQEESAPLRGAMREVLGICLNGFGTWLLVAAVPLAVQAMELAYVATSPTGSSEGAGRSIVIVGVNLFVAITYAAPATAWIRGVICAAPPHAVAFSWGRREFMYLTRGVQLGLAVGLIALGCVFVLTLVISRLGGPVTPDGAAGHGLSWLGSGAGVGVLVLLLGLTMWLMADWLMVLPAAANGDESSFRRSAALTRTHRLRIILVGLTVGVAGLATALLVGLGIGGLAVLTTIAGPAARSAAMAVASVVSGVLGSAIGSMFHATALGVIYRRLASDAARGDDATASARTLATAA